MKRWIILFLCLLLTTGCFGKDDSGQSSQPGTGAEPVTDAETGTDSGTGAEPDANAGTDSEAEPGTNAGTTPDEGDNLRETGEPSDTPGDDAAVPGLDIAQRDVNLFLEMMRQGNTKELIPLVNELWLNEEISAAKMIEGFAHNFDLATLTAEPTYEGYAMWPEGGQYEFKLVDQHGSDNGQENFLVIRYDELGNRYIHHPYIRYFPHAESLVAGYLDLIRQEKAAELASYLNADDLDIPVWVGEEIIRRYKENFAEGEWTLEYIKQFDFVVSDREGKTHDIRVIHGDGLMSIRDEWIPDFQ